MSWCPKGVTLLGKAALQCHPGTVREGCDLVMVMGDSAETLRVTRQLYGVAGMPVASFNIHGTCRWHNLPHNSHLTCKTGPTLHSAPVWFWGLTGWRMYEVSLDYGKRHLVGWYHFMTSMSLIFSSAPSKALLGSKTPTSKNMPLRTLPLLPDRCHWIDPMALFISFEVNWTKSLMSARQAHYLWAMSLARNFSNSHVVYIVRMCLNHVVES